MITDGPKDKIVIATTSCIATPKSPSSFDPVTSILKPGAPVPEVCASNSECEKLKIAQNGFENKKQDRFSFLKADAQHLPFLDKTIDAAICINTFYNFHAKSDVVDALEEMERVCKRDGFIIFDIRNRINPFVFLRFKFVWIYDTHVTLNAYSLKELTTVLTSRGLVITETIPIGFPITMFAPIILVKAGYQ